MYNFIWSGCSAAKCSAIIVSSELPSSDEHLPVAVVLGKNTVYGLSQKRAVVAAGDVDGNKW